ncbi:hypothetical protein BKA22_003266 [Cellulomonas soli]|nr:hypothetical protein [Cellulomonas soli]NYI60521.1 hypothetical protein [Cellulomonas soli]
MTEHDAPEGRKPSQTAAERLAALTRENADLRAQVAALSAAPAAPATVVVAGPPARHHRTRAFFAALLIVLGVVLAPVSVVVAWAQAEVTDTDRYVATVGPLAQDPVIQSAVANRLTAEVMKQIDVGALLDDAVSALDQQGLPPRVTTTLSALEVPLTNGVRSFVLKAATRVVESDAFSTAWVEANRTAHEQMVAVMEGQPGSVLQIGSEGQLTIQLAGMIDMLKTRLVEGGFGIAANIPTVNASFTLVQTSELVRVQNAYQLLDVAGSWLPWISLLLIAAGVLTARNRSRALVVAGLSLAGAMLVLGLGLTVGRTFYLRALSDQVVRLDAAAVVFDQLVAFIRLSLRTVGVAALVVAAAAYLGGRSDSARTLRAESARGFAAARTWAEGRGVSTGPVGAWLFRHKSLVRVLVLAVAGLVVLLAASPTPPLVITVALVAGALVVLLELVARPPGPATSAPDGEDPAPVAG